MVTKEYIVNRIRATNAGMGHRPRNLSIEIMDQEIYTLALEALAAREQREGEVVVEGYIPSDDETCIILPGFIDGFPGGTRVTVTIRRKVE